MTCDASANGNRQIAMFVDGGLQCLDQLVTPLLRAFSAGRSFLQPYSEFFQQFVGDAGVLENLRDLLGFFGVHLCSPLRNPRAISTANCPLCATIGEGVHGPELSVVEWCFIHFPTSQ